VVLGPNVVCDGYDENATVHIITHAHSDHIRGLGKSIRYAPYVGMTPATKEILEVLGYRIPRHKYLELEYERPFKIVDDILYLKPARHIVGSAQVVVEYMNVKIVYTGDFKLPGTPIIDTDVLVIESTYGNPQYTRPFKDEIETLFVDLVKDTLVKGPVVIYGYHGKLQEAMEIIREHGLDVPFIAPYKVYKIAKIAEKYGMKISPLYREGSIEAEEAIRSGWFIVFHHMNSRRRNYGRCSHIILSGWEFEEPIRRLDYDRYLVALSDHADFEDLLEYVENAKPKLVIVDGSRSGSPHALAKEITKRFNIKSIVMP